MGPWGARQCMQPWTEESPSFTTYMVCSSYLVIFATQLPAPLCKVEVVWQLTHDNTACARAAGKVEQLGAAEGATAAGDTQRVAYTGAVACSLHSFSCGCIPDAPSASSTKGFVQCAVSAGPPARPLATGAEPTKSEAGESPDEEARPNGVHPASVAAAARRPSDTTLAAGAAGTAGEAARAATQPNGVHPAGEAAAGSNRVCEAEPRRPPACQ